MALEDLTGPNKFIANLVPANPPATDPAEQGCDHIQGIKNVLQNSFPGMSGAYKFGAPLTVLGPSIELGSVTAPNTTFIDFHSSGTATDYEARISREPGDNGGLTITNKGNGSLTLQNNELIAMAVAGNSNIAFRGATGLAEASFKLGSDTTLSFSGSANGAVPGVNSIVSFDNAGTAYKPLYIVGYSFNITCQAIFDNTIESKSTVKATAYYCRAGQSGAYGGNVFNINHGTGQQLWIDSTNMGTIAFQSDYRIKKDIQSQKRPALERITQLRPVTYEFADFGDLFHADGVKREGFIAHELAEVIPSAVDGEKDAENQIQSLRLDALCSVMVKAIQELQAEVEALKAR